MRSCIENTVQLKNAVFSGGLMRRKQVYDEFKSFFVFEICPAYVYCCGEINFIDVFGIFRCFYHSVRSH